MILYKNSTIKIFKGIMVFNGKPAIEWLSREDASFTTESLEAIFKTTTIDAYEGRGIMVLGVPNTFVWNNIPPKQYGEESIIIKI